MDQKNTINKEGVLGRSYFCGSVNCRLLCIAFYIWLTSLSFLSNTEFSIKQFEM